jgi:hypothetical protein
MLDNPHQTYFGSCYCGAVRFQIESDFPELTTCDCSICRRKNTLTATVNESQFKLLLGGDSLTEYSFHTKTARHYFCKVCGICPFYRKRISADTYGINVFCLENFNSTDIPIRHTLGSGKV